MVGSKRHHFELSVVVPAYNRQQTLRETLRHLAEQEPDPAEYEVVIVDDGSPAVIARRCFANGRAKDGSSLLQCLRRICCPNRDVSSLKQRLER
jgi:cellulose synthase/poly-beta-1,6-N-acetylglucosamine synthase-like glycosyltransferase